MKKFNLKMVSTKIKKEQQDIYGLSWKNDLMIETEDGKIDIFDYGKSRNKLTKKESDNDKMEAFGHLLLNGIECMIFKDNPEKLLDYYMIREYGNTNDIYKIVESDCENKKKLNNLGFTDTNIKQLINLKQYPLPSFPSAFLKQKRNYLPE